MTIKDLIVINYKDNNFNFIQFMKISIRSDIGPVIIDL